MKNLKKSQSGQEKGSIMMYFCGRRKSYPRTQIILSETRQLTNYSGPQVGFHCPTTIHLKDTLNLNKCLQWKLYRK